MKKIALTLGVVVAALVLVGCASKGTADSSVAAQPSANAHHDFKGEVK